MGEGLPVQVAQYIDVLGRRFPGLSETAVLKMAAILSGLQEFHGAHGRALTERLIFYVGSLARMGAPWALEALPRIARMSEVA